MSIKSVTVLISEGIVPAEILNKVNELAARYQLKVYLSTMQNIRILDIREEEEEEIKNALLAVGAKFKAPGQFPLPRVCVGKSYCKLGLVDTFSLSEKIVNQFKGRTKVKPKLKIAVSGCPASCSNSLVADIGVKATRSGFDIYAGGKGGAAPQKGQRVARSVDENQVIEIITQLVDFHDQKTGKKQRMSKLLNEPDFPFKEELKG